MYRLPEYDVALLQRVVTEQCVEGFRFLFHPDTQGRLRRRDVSWFMETSDFLFQLLNTEPMPDAGLFFVQAKLQGMYRMLLDPDFAYVYDEFGELLLYEMIVTCSAMMRSRELLGEEGRWSVTCEDERAAVFSFFEREAARLSPSWRREMEFRPKEDLWEMREILKRTEEQYAKDRTEAFTDFTHMAYGFNEGFEVLFYGNDFEYFYDLGLPAFQKVFGSEMGRALGTCSLSVMMDPDGYRRKEPISGAEPGKG